MRSALKQDTLCPAEDKCPDAIFSCRACGYFGSQEIDLCPSCGAGWKSIDVSHGPDCPRTQFDEAMESSDGALLRRCFRLLNACNMRLTVGLQDLTAEEFEVMLMVDAEKARLAKSPND